LASGNIEMQLPLLAQRAARNALTTGSSLVFWTWVASLCLHAVILLPLAFIRPSSTAARAAVTPVTPTARVEAVRNALRESTILPKPKVAGPATIAETAGELPQLSPDLPRPAHDNESLKPIVRGNSVDSKSPSTTRSRYKAPQVEFFGSRLDRRKVCFVVDASGSMLGLFSSVGSNLAGSIQSLQPDQYFNIVFFNDRLYESSPGVLTRTTSSAKTAAISFMRGIQPAGPTNPLAAFERAMRCRDSSGEAPAVIYFLTDGFDLTPRDADDLPAAVESLRKQLAPAAKINTIGFWTQPHDCDVLKKIATDSGGEFVSVNK
jgi:hypothetical protein